MKCPKCGNTDLLPKFKCCPECGSLLHHASNVPSSGTKEAIAQTTAEQGDAGDNSGLGVDNKRIQDIDGNRQQGNTTTDGEHDELSTAQSATPSGDHDQSSNPPAAKGAASLGMHATPETKPAGDSLEAGVEIARSEQTEQQFHDMKGSGESRTTSSVIHVTCVQTVRSAAELEEGNLRGTSYVASEERKVLGDSNEPLDHWHTTSSYIQLQPRKPPDHHLHQQPQSSSQQHQQQRKRHVTTLQLRLRPLQQRQKDRLLPQQRQLPPLQQQQNQQLSPPQQQQHHHQQPPALHQQQHLPPPPNQQVFNQHQQLSQQQSPPPHQQPKNKEVNHEDNRTFGDQEYHVSPIVQTSGSNNTNEKFQVSQDNERAEYPSSLTAQKQEEAKYMQKKESSEAGPPETRHVVEDRDVTLKDENVETTTLVLADPVRNEPALEPALEHPLSEQMSEGDRKGAEPTKKSTGQWPQSKTKPQQDSTSGRKKNETQISKKEDKNKAVQPQLGIAQVPLNLEQVEPENGVTVVFHVLLETNFKMEEEHLHIRAQEEDLGNFGINCVDLSLIGNGKGKKKLMRFSGQFTLNMARAQIGTSYKYVILEKDKVHWERLVEFTPKHGGILNRFLLIPHKYRKPGAKWDKFDCVAYIYGEMNWLERFYDTVRIKHTVENRKSALLMQLPKWKGFLVDEPGEEMTATTALFELDRVVSCITDVWVEEDGANPEMKKPAEFNIKTVLVELLQPKVSENATAQGKTDLNARASALVSSLAILLLLKQYKMRLEKEYMLLLLKCLALEVDPTDKMSTTYEVVLKEFSEGLRA